MELNSPLKKMIWFSKIWIKSLIKKKLHSCDNFLDIWTVKNIRLNMCFFLNKCSFLQNSVFSINCWAGKVNSTIQNKIEGIDFSFFFSIKGQEMLLPKPYPLSHIAFRVFPFSRQEKFISDIIGKRKQINCCHRLNYSEILSFIHA